MSPILVRPVREQLEHDRVIRLLQAKYKRKFDVAINPGNEQTAPVGSGPSAWYPDLVLHSVDKAHRLAGVVEVESAESVNHLEAMSQWRAFAALNVPFHLYVPTAAIDTARRFCAEINITVAELWAYQAVGDQIRFALVQRSEAAEVRERPVRTPAADVPAPVEPRPRAAAARAATARTPAATNGRPAAAAPARTRTNGQTSGRPAGRRAAAPAPRTATSRTATSRTATPRTAPKPKAAAARRPAAKATAARKTKSTAGSRAQKRR